MKSKEKTEERCKAEGRVSSPAQWMKLDPKDRRCFLELLIIKAFKNKETDISFISRS